MNAEMFAELMESIEEGGKILRGEKPASRKTASSMPNVKRIREQYQLSQTEFAQMLGVSARTLRNWELGRRVPRGTARVLLQVAAQHPEAVLDVMRQAER